MWLIVVFSLYQCFFKVSGGGSTPMTSSSAGPSELIRANHVQY